VGAILNAIRGDRPAAPQQDTVQADVVQTDKGAGRKKKEDVGKVKLIEDAGRPSIGPPEAKPNPKQPTIVDDTAFAPPPRPVDPRRPPSGFDTPWQRVGAIETRVTGIAVIPIRLVDRNHKEFPAVGPLLAIWVETRNVSPGRKELRRWIGAFESLAQLSGSDGRNIPVAKFDSALQPLLQLDGTHQLPSGGPPVLDVLVFTLPKTDQQTLTLKLNASHVGEIGTFTHTIPASAWKR
jgi:hypothetical protein